MWRNCVATVRSRWNGLVAIACLLLQFGSASATIYYSKDEALEEAFGVDAAVELHPIFLTDGQVSAIQQKAKVNLDSQLYSFYEGRRNGQVVGYAAIESHTVRTQPETLLLVLSPEGKLTKTLMLAFHEPPEYQPPARWFSLLLGKPIEELALSYGVDGVSGATLSSRAALDSARKILAIFELGFREGQE